MNNISTALLSFACLAFAPLPAYSAGDGSTHRFVEVGDAKLYVQTFARPALKYRASIRSRNRSFRC